MPGQRDLTNYQKRVLRFIEDYVDEHGYAPRYAEIASGIGTRTTAAVAHTLDQIQALGYIRRTPGISRAITLLKRSEQPAPECVEDAVALITKAIIESTRIAPSVDVLPYLDRVLLQWPGDGPAFMLDVQATNIRADVIEHRGDVPVVDYRSGVA